MSEETDDLDEFLTLAPRPASEPSRQRAEILESTLRTLWVRSLVRRLVRYGATLAGVAAVFVAGVGIGLRQAPPIRETVFVATPAPPAEIVTVTIPFVVPLPGGSGIPEQAPKPAQTARALELDAEQADDAAMAAALYRRAGDAYLTSEQDYVNAARCYRLFLTRGGTSALVPDAGDSWLLTSLKNSAFKETVHATPPRG
jgi:hypothetical protein